MVYRTGSGELVVADAHCPHVGTHLGQGATIEGDYIRCPLHGLRFEPHGACVEARARGGSLMLRVHPVCEVAGMVFSWYAPDQSPPSFALPELDDQAFLPYRIRTERLDLAMEEPLEVHAVDIGHNTTLHAEQGVEPVEPLTIDASSTHAALVMRHPATPTGKRMLRLLGVHDGYVETHVEVRTVGLGYQHIRSTVASMGIVVNQFMLAVPRAANEVDLNVVYSMQRLDRARLPRLFRMLPLPLLEPVFDRAGYDELMAATDEHMGMWTRKRQLAAPGWFPDEDGLRRYRTWADGFYE
ncbi:Toluene-4-sulfonate monooxygenase system iron-sulfur subunit TsaM1 [Enhygromyxa salina]|uniref:Toluene-4-sulfonate monooxygenase system iron-sulfur subunit TsaM1 n=1 Tax=Enhygromyxa salina TaxID=215803 RepID=A0A2S9XQS1_9BACT|nr:Toluene-4-sulfonate monooxygenase system iron-sulfur subunit TsaM1 [Enhygromyxa salina]